MGSWGGKREGAGCRTGSGLYGEPTKSKRVPVGMFKALELWLDLYRVKKCVLTAARLLVAQLETNEKKK